MSEDNPNKVGDSAPKQVTISLPQYLNILTGATVRFGQYMKEKYPDLGDLSQEDWWDQWEHWCAYDPK